MKNKLNKQQLKQWLKFFGLFIFFTLVCEKIFAQIKTDSIKGKHIIESENKISYSNKTEQIKIKTPPDSIQQKTDSLLLANGWYPNQDSYDLLNSKFHCGDNHDSVFCAAQSYFSNQPIENNINQNTVERDYEKALKLKNKMGRQLFDNCHITDSNIHKFLANNQLLLFHNAAVEDSVHKELELLKESMIHLSKLINQMWDDTLTISGNTTNLLNDDMKEMNSAFTSMPDTLTVSDLENLLIIKVYADEVTGIMQQALKNAKLKVGFSDGDKINYYSSLCNFSPLDNYPKAVIKNTSDNEIMVNVRTIDTTSATRDGLYAFYLPRSAYILKKTDKTQRFSQTTCKAVEPFAFGARYYLWIENNKQQVLATPQEFEIKANSFVSDSDKTPLMTIHIIIK